MRANIYFHFDLLRYSKGLLRRIVVKIQGLPSGTWNDQMGPIGTRNAHTGREGLKGGETVLMHLLIDPCDCAQAKTSLEVMRLWL